MTLLRFEAKVLGVQLKILISAPIQQPKVNVQKLTAFIVMFHNLVSNKSKNVMELCTAYMQKMKILISAITPLLNQQQLNAWKETGLLNITSKSKPLHAMKKESVKIKMMKTVIAMIFSKALSC